jgi:hypothetical protein
MGESKSKKCGPSHQGDPSPAEPIKGHLAYPEIQREVKTNSGGMVNLTWWAHGVGEAYQREKPTSELEVRQFALAPMLQGSASLASASSLTNTAGKILRAKRDICQRPKVSYKAHSEFESRFLLELGAHDSHL